MIYKIITDKKLLATAFEIRKKVFIEEHGVPYNLEIDEYEDICFHFLVYSNKGKAFRGQNIGKQLMHFMELKAIEVGYHKAVVEAQSHALNFTKV